MHLRSNIARWLRAHAVHLTAVLLVCAQIGWTAALLAHSYFRQGDFEVLDRALTSGFGWKYLMWLGGAQKGHLMPLGLAIAWATARASVYNWLLASVVIGALVAAASLALVRLLLTLFGARPAILVPLAVYMFGPLSLGTIAWWSAALAVIPLQLAIFMAVSAHVRYLRSNRLRHSIIAALWLAVGMAAADQGALVPLLLLVVTAGYFVPGRWTDAIRRAVTGYWRAWLSYAAVLASYCVVFFLQLAGSGLHPAGPGLASRLYEFAGTLIANTALPGALGGPWHWLSTGFAQAKPPVALVVLSFVLAACVIAVSCLYRMRAWRAWAILLAWVVAADIVPVAISGFGTLPPATLATQTGYLADATAVLALCLGLAFIPLKDTMAPALKEIAAPILKEIAAPVVGEIAAPVPSDTAATAAPTAPPLADPLTPLTAPTLPKAPLRAIPRPVRIVTLLAFCVFAAGTVVSLQAFELANPSTAARSYIATARLAVRDAPRGTVIVDGPTPATVMDPGFFPPPQGFTSQVIGALARGKRADRWTAALDGVVADPMTFDDRGQLRPVTVLGPSGPANRTGQACRYVSAAGTNIKLSGSLYRWPWTVRVSYSGPGGLLAVSFGPNGSQVMLPAGSHVVYLPVVGEGNMVGVQFAGDTARALCVTGVTVGSLHPDQAGRAIPAAPVRG